MAKAPPARRGSRPTPSAAPVADVPTGCCIIEAPAVPDRQVEGLTKSECDAIANAHPGTVTHWVEGRCA
jgi:hypothetical protein